MKTTLLSTIARDELQQELSRFGEVGIATGEHDMMEALHEADALVMSTPGLYTSAFAEKLSGSTSLRWIQFLSAGYDGPQSYGIPAGSVLTNAGDCWSPTVAEHGISLLLSLLRRLPECVRAQGEQKWDSTIRPTLGSLEGATVTILGFGSVGRELAIRLRTFGAHVIGVTRSGIPVDAGSAADQSVAIAQLHQCLRTSDALVIALPLTGDTRHIVNADTLAQLPSHALVVNLSRGGTLDGAALANALEQGRLAGAALDVTEPEPLPSSDPLWNAPNLIITPHIAGFGSPALGLRLVRLVAENARRFAAGQKLLHQVEVPVMR